MRCRILCICVAADVWLARQGPSMPLGSPSADYDVVYLLLIGVLDVFADVLYIIGYIGDDNYIRSPQGLNRAM